MALWLEKTGKKPPEDLSQKDAVRWGTLLEPLIAQAYAEQTGKKVRRVNAILQHPEHPYLLANLDRIIEGGGKPPVRRITLRMARHEPADPSKPPVRRITANSSAP